MLSMMVQAKLNELRHRVGQDPDNPRPRLALIAVLRKRGVAPVP